MIRLDLRSRLLAAVGLVALLQVVVAFTFVTVTRNQLVDQLDDRLAIASSPERESRPDRPASDDFDGGDEPRGHPDDERHERLGDTYEGVLRVDGTLQTFFAPNSTGSELPPPMISTEQAAGSKGRPISVGSTDGSVDYRLAASDLGDGEYFVTAIPLASAYETVDRLTAAVVAATVVVAMVLALVTLWVLRLGIEPIKRMTVTAEAIAEGDMSERIVDVDQRTEAGQLGHALNIMLSRIETSFDERTRAEERLRQFIADASHELRTPVATIRGYAELYRFGGLENKADLDDAMRRTEQESQRMSRLIADMLNLAKLDRKPTLNSQPVDLAAVARDTAADAQVTHPDRSIEAVAEEPSPIVNGDEDLLRQMLANLVGNALVHTDGEARVTIRTRLVDQTAVVEVADTGPGMSSEVLEKATERFYRADPSRSRHQGGSGLGLAIVSSIAQAHGGRFSLASEVGRGTTATATFPA